MNLCQRLDPGIEQRSRFSRGRKYVDAIGWESAPEMLWEAIDPIGGKRCWLENTRSAYRAFA